MVNPPPVAPLDEDDPRTVGPYALLGRLGDGGMGTVNLGQRAEDADTPSPATGHRLVAVKVIRADLARIAEYRDRFLREARAAQRVAAFCSAEVLGVGTNARQPYLVTEFINGPSLARAYGRAGRCQRPRSSASRSPSPRR